MGLILFVTGLLLFLLGTALVFYANLVAERLVQEVNAKSPADEKIGYNFLQWKMAEVLSRHQALYPASQLRRRTHVVGLTGILVGALGVVLLLAASARR